MGASVDIKTVESAVRSSIRYSIARRRYIHFQVGLSVHRTADELTDKCACKASENTHTSETGWLMKGCLS